MMWVPDEANRPRQIIHSAGYRQEVPGVAPMKLDLDLKKLAQYATPLREKG